MLTRATTELPVLIIGGGLGGLTLAHSLQKHKVPFRLFERDSAASQRAQGYRISIDEGGSNALNQALSPEVYARYVQTCAASHPPGGRLDARTGELVGKGVLGLLTTGGWGMLARLVGRYVGGRDWKRIVTGGILCERVATLPKGKEADRQVDRRVLRSVLLDPIREYVRFDSTLVSYDVRDGVVSARFLDGSSFDGSLLVGADGTRSRVARQLIGDHAQPRNLGVRIVYGKTPADAALLDSLHPMLRHGTNFVTDTEAAGRRILLVQEVMRFSHENAPQDYVFWALSAPEKAFDGSDAPSSARRLTAEWHPDIRVIIDRQSSDDTALLNMSALSPVTWTTDARVTLLGDAVHCMPPTGGQGANSAIYDAALLGSILGASCEGWDLETIATYERGMRYNIGDIVGLACIGLSGLLEVDEYQ